MKSAQIKMSCGVMKDFFISVSESLCLSIRSGSANNREFGSFLQSCVSGKHSTNVVAGYCRRQKKIDQRLSSQDQTLVGRQSKPCAVDKFPNFHCQFSTTNLYLANSSFHFPTNRRPQFLLDWPDLRRFLLL